MEDLQTSPETSAPEASVDTGSVAETDSAATTASATADAAASQGESPVPSGSVAGSQGETATLSEGANGESERPTSGFNPESWDGNLDSLPDDLRGPVSFLHRQLESGYTKKFQTLSDERKAFETERTAATGNTGNWAEEKEALSGELDLYKRILGGEEDPRFTELTGKHGELTTQHTALQNEYNAYKSHIEADIKRDAEAYAERFSKTHAAIFEDAEQRNELVNLLDQDWEPEDAVKLVGKQPNVVQLANELRKQGTKPKLALEHAFLKLGEANAPRKPRPGARMTSGAESRNNPESIQKDITHTSDSREARSMAARAAMNWQAKNRTA